MIHAGFAMRSFRGFTPAKLNWWNYNTEGHVDFEARNLWQCRSTNTRI
jgi:hypothetical protein